MKKTNREDRKKLDFRSFFERLGNQIAAFFRRAGTLLQWMRWDLILRPILRHRKRAAGILTLLVCFSLILAAMIFALSAAVCDKTEDRILTPEELRSMGGEFDYILVLGCKVHEDGSLSHMLQDRVKTGVALYQAGIGNKILMSGDRRDEDYDEVRAMRAAAIQAGVNPDAIVTDPAGFSTYDSVMRLLRVYEGKRVVIVTQSYHLSRALYIAEKIGVDAYGVSADLRGYSGQAKRDLREVFARCKDVFYALCQPPAAGLSV